MRDWLGQSELVSSLWRGKALSCATSSLCFQHSQAFGSIISFVDRFVYCVLCTIIENDEVDGPFTGSYI